MAEQLSFDLPVRVAGGRSSFYVSDANALAVASLDAPHTWPGRKMILQGPPSCGKSHLLDIWRGDTGALAMDMTHEFDLPPTGAHVVVDDIDHIAGHSAAETRLFHLHNHLQANNGTLLMAASQPIAACGFALPDLISRLQATSVTRIDAPDDDLLAAVLLKAFTDRQLSPPPNAQAYILKHMDRSFAAATAVVAELDRISMAEKRPITRAMAAQVLQG